MVEQPYSIPGILDPVSGGIDAIRLAELLKIETEAIAEIVGRPQVGIPAYSAGCSG